MIEFLGSDPCGRTEYGCKECGRYFEIRELDDDGEEIDEPATVTHCPYCDEEAGD